MIKCFNLIAAEILKYGKTAIMIGRKIRFIISIDRAFRPRLARGARDPPHRGRASTPAREVVRPPCPASARRRAGSKTPGPGATFVPAAGHVRGRGDGRADRAGIDEPAARLQPAAEERVRHLRARRAPRPSTAPPPRASRRGLLVVDVLPGAGPRQERPPRGRGMVRFSTMSTAGSSAVPRARARAARSELRRGLCGAGGDEVGDRRDLDGLRRGEVLEVDAADVARSRGCRCGVWWSYELLSGA